MQNRKSQVGEQNYTRRPFSVHDWLHESHQVPHQRPHHFNTMELGFSSISTELLRDIQQRKIMVGCISR